MSESKKASLETIWRVPDALWERMSLDPTTKEKKHPGRRWVVERTLACALLWFRRLHRQQTTETV